METEIQKFYKDKQIFLTGGSGFLGKVFVEKVLRSTEVAQIYILMRTRREQSGEDRMQNIFNDPLFEKLRQLKPEAFKRVRAIPGDCAEPNLGLAASDRMQLIENVDIIVHGAATVRFNEKFNIALAINTRAPYDLIKLAKEMQKLKAYVHVSSAFANCLDLNIEEHYYTHRLPYSYVEMQTLSESMSIDKLNSISNELCQPFPNTYTYTKAAAEEVVLKEAGDLPICIFRPGIVIATYKEPVAGWIDNLYGPTSILFGAAYGVLRVMYVRLDADAGVVPVDYCANIMLACAWYTAKHKRMAETEKPLIYNLVPDEHNRLKWRGYKDAVLEYGLTMPLSNMIWFPFLIATTSKFGYKLLCFLYHTLPGYIIDFGLFLSGGKPRMIRTYRKIHHTTEMITYFADRNWTFGAENTKRLWVSLTQADQQLFPFDMGSVKWSEYFYNALCGMRLYLAKESPDTIPKALKLLNRLKLLHHFVQFVIYGTGVALILLTLSTLFL